MKKILVFITGAVTVLVMYNCTDNPVTASPGTKEKTKEEKIEHGKYLATTMGCHDCHTPKKMGPQGPEPDMENMLSGHPAQVPLPPMPKDATGWVLTHPMLTAFAGPWGVSYAANLTSDSTGIGTWTYNQFKTAVTKGKWKGIESARPLLPPMPWQNYINAKEEDMQDLFEFLKSTKPIKNIVPAPMPPGK